MKTHQFAFFSKDAEILKGLLTQVRSSIKECEDSSLKQDLHLIESTLTSLLKIYGG